MQIYTECKFSNIPNYGDELRRTFCDGPRMMACRTWTASAGSGDSASKHHFAASSRPCTHTALFPPSRQRPSSFLFLSSTLRPVVWRPFSWCVYSKVRTVRSVPGHGHRGHPAALRDASVPIQGDHPRYAAGPSLLAADAMGPPQPGATGTGSHTLLCRPKRSRPCCERRPSRGICVVWRSSHGACLVGMWGIHGSAVIHGPVNVSCARSAAMP